jgi:transcriptional regulator with XRE-family HTH domain
VTSGTLIREARLLAGFSQGELSERSGKDRAQIARWERDVVQPSFETLQDLVRACGFDLESRLVPYELDKQHDLRLQKTLKRSPQERTQAMLRARSKNGFDPIALLQGLDEHRVRYIVVGAVGRVIHGSGEVTDGLDVVPSTIEVNIRRLGSALGDLNARRRDRAPIDLEGSLAREPVLELETDAGELKIVPEPAGTRGYNDLRRDARGEPLGRGVRPTVASIADHARMLVGLNRERDLETLRTVRRMIELDRGRTRGLTLER